MQTVKQILEEIYSGKMVKITIGHTDNNQHIIAKCVGFVDGYGGGNGVDWREQFFILLKEVTSNSEWLKYPIESGQFDKHYFRLDTEIELLRDENLNQLLENK